MNKTLCIITCPPYPKYQEQPKDQSHCELFHCPKCKNQMWLSQMKKGTLLFNACIGNEILLCCYDCFEDIARDNPGLLQGSEEVRI